MPYDPNQPATPESSPIHAAVPTAPVAPAPVTAATPAQIPAAKAASRGSGGRLINAILGLAIVVAIGGVAFAIGRTTAPASAATTGRGGFGANFPNGSFTPNASGAPGFGGGRGFGGGGAGLTIRGTVESVTGDTVTIKTANGQTIEVSTGADTTYNTQTPASASDVTDGATVQVQLQLNAAGGAGNALRPGASDAPTGPVGTAGSITVVP
jgi:hypothetical protein